MVTVDTRQIAVKHDYVVVGPRSALHRVRTVIHNIDSEPRVAQALADPVSQRNVILHYQHSHALIVPTPA
jgi:hypothetical protein